MSGRVPPSSRAGARLPRGDDVQRASDLRERFTGEKTEPAGTVTVPKIPRVVAVIGHCDFIGYTTRRDGKVEKYVHDFAKKDRPLLCVNPDGSQILLVGGDYDFTERGIVDGSDWKTRSEL